MPVTRYTTSCASRESPFSQRQGPIFIRRPSQVSIDSLCNPRLPARYLHAGLKMSSQMCYKTQRAIRDLALHHIDFSIPYLEQSQSQIDFFKREVLLDRELSHLMHYEDAWAVEVFLGKMYNRPRIMRNFQKLNSELQIMQHDRQRQSDVHSINPVTQIGDVQHDRPRQTSLAICSGNQITRPTSKDAQHDLVCSDNQATPEPQDNQVNAIQDGGASDTASCLTLLSTLLASTPGFHRFHAVIIEAGLSTDEHLYYFFRMTFKGRERFVTEALKETSTLFERVVIMDILEELRDDILVGRL
ncbi:uncharacterized protein EDB93DRAFT_1177042 [Suillus bovinus]|uniref:uncharacterized protein n=1 Tax=Suillus bovinus TaxID=48563 RepID=UPI001B877B0C|nr:uncharacterized protein EDB93DRAFT_1177042 [Suillus bovinus]KAG2132306.1 hypothetical protein EDB93DRAFT_1177042 [Suillus bovinus]